MMMVTYEFICDICGIPTSVDRVMGDTEAPECLCGDKMRRVYHSIPIKFNADGFYSTGG